MSDAKEQLLSLLQTLLAMVVMLALVGGILQCAGRTPAQPSTTDYVREHGLPPDPYDRTPPANR
jgi:hypothetical protein